MKIRFEYKPEDAWIGAFWKTDKEGLKHIWICILPCLPLHIMWRPRGE